MRIFRLMPLRCRVSLPMLFGACVALFVVYMLYPRKVYDLRKRRSSNSIRSKTPSLLKRACVVPKLDPFDKEAMKYFELNISKPECHKKSFAKLKNGFLEVKANGVRDAYFSYILRNNGNDFGVGLSSSNKIKQEGEGKDNLTADFERRTAVHGDFLELVIEFENSVHKEYLLSVKEKETVIKRANKNKPELAYNVAILVFDSQSASNFERNLPKTFATLKNDENTVIMKGHTVVGDGTTAQISAMLVGALEENLSEARRSKPGAQTVDRWPFIFKDYTQRGYVTFFNEDTPTIGCFNYRLHGFKNPPTDHYGRPFWLKASSGTYNDFCLTDKFLFDYNLDYALSFFNAYKNIPKFSITLFSSPYHAADMNIIRISDSSILQFIKAMKEDGHLDETILLIMGDHGARATNFRETIVGKLEERLPFLSVTMPTKLIKKHPEFKAALKHNSEGLTSHFDIHATLHHLLNFPREPKVSFGQSLFTMIDPSNRTCDTAGVKDFWCPCLEFSDLPIDNKDVIEAALSTVDFINREVIGPIPDAKSQCRVLELDNIIRAGKRIPNTKVQRFKETRADSKCDECGVIYEENSNVEILYFEIVFRVKDSGGIFEAQATKHGKKWIVDKEISRLNLYGDQPKCIMKNYPYLRKYCYCNNKNNKK